jgi:hypothetical protein
MRKLLLFAVPLFVVGSLGAAQAAHHSAFAKTALCHKVNSKTKPYQRIVATNTAMLKTYIAKPADIIPAPRTCPQTLLTPSAGGVGLSVNMLGVAEQPDLADPDGKGVATFHLRKGQGQVCFSLNVQSIGQATGAHIHKGAVDASGPVSVALATPNAAGTSSGCVAAPRVTVADILANRTSYYANVHNAEFANGAVRGQLQRPTNVAILTAAMLGANEKPNAGDPDGAGFGNFFLNPDKSILCYTLAATNVALPATGAHIHRGDATIAGPVIIPFTNPSATGTSSACVTADAALLREIIANPGGFYANIHSTEFTGGAVRAALQMTT